MKKLKYKFYKPITQQSQYLSTCPSLFFDNSIEYARIFHICSTQGCSLLSLFYIYFGTYGYWSLWNFWPSFLLKLKHLLNRRANRTISSPSLEFSLCSSWTTLFRAELLFWGVLEASNFLSQVDSFQTLRF